MKYQRVLYTDKFTTELKSKLRIVSYDKRRSLKGNVYYVSFASDADIEHADQTCKRLRNVMLKPFQPRQYSEAKQKDRISIRSHQETATPSSTPFLSPSTMLTFLPDCRSASITSEPGSLQQANETLEEHAMRVLGACTASRQHVVTTPTLEASNLVSFSPDVSLIDSHEPSNIKDKEQLIDSVQSCLSVMETARRAADELCQLHKRGIDCRAALNHFFKVHSTAFYLKAATSAQIKAVFHAGLRLPWSDVANSINVLKSDIRHEQSFMTQVTSAQYILSKIDSATSMAMSSKLAYQLAKLSH